MHCFLLDMFDEITFNYFQAMISLGATCGLSDLTAEINFLKTKSLDLFTPKMRNQRGLCKLWRKKSLNNKLLSFDNVKMSCL